jgi:ATP-binding cassette subfamily B protein RaxB
VDKAIQQLPMTRIVIAHRQETILNADVIYQLYEGRLKNVTESYRAGLGVNAE